MTKTRKIVISILAVGVSAIIINTNHQYSQKINQGDSFVASGKYDEASTAYAQALKLKANNEVETKLNKTLILKSSTDDFKDGMSDFNAKDYNLALTSFKSVIREDSENYRTAVDKIKQCIKLEDDSQIKLAKEYASSKEYKTAIQCVNTALSIDASNQQLIDLKNKYTNEKADAEANAVAEANAKAKADDIAKAKADAVVKANADAKARTKGVKIGMTTDECINSIWGKPNSIHRTTTANGTSEQWVYGNTSYLYFDNGILTNIQN
ncbi:MAG TPA: hypothetical protein VIM42_01105 [Clostridium sp.]